MVKEGKGDCGVSDNATDAHLPLWALISLVSSLHGLFSASSWHVPPHSPQKIAVSWERTRQS